jgi:hypothetical protein
MLALAVVAVAVPFEGDLRAQELTPPPAPSSATEQDGTAFRAEHGPCFYNPYRWMARGRLNQTLMASEMNDLARGWGAGSGLDGCTDRYGLTSFDFFAGWGYMLIDGVRRPERVTQAQVKAVREATRKAAAGETERPAQPTPLDLTPPDEPETRSRVREEHAPIPPIGSGYGSNALASRSVEFRVAPGPKPATYNGIPIVERGRAWERVQTPDGRRLWVQKDLAEAHYRNGAAIGLGNSARSRSALSAADGEIQRQEGIRSAPRAAASAPQYSSPRSSASTHSSGTRLQSPRAGKKTEQ